MNIVCHYSNNPPFTSETHRRVGIGGTENFACNVAVLLAKLGNYVRFYNMTPTNEKIDGIEWDNIRNYNPSEPIDLLISFRMREVFQQANAAKVKLLILADTESHGLGDDVRSCKIDKVMAVSQWQLNKVAAEEGLIGQPCWILGSNGVNPIEYGNWNPNRQTGMCIHLSTPERGLSRVLRVWPYVEDSYVLKALGIVPELHLFSSFRGWGVSEEENENMCKELYHEIGRLAEYDSYHIINHKHVNLNELREFQNKADIFIYPTNFKETYCMSLQESMFAGVIPVVSNVGAMPERVKREWGYVVGEPDEDPDTEDYTKKFAYSVVEAITIKGFKGVMRKLCHDMAARHAYDVIVPQWLNMIEKSL